MRFSLYLLSALLLANFQYIFAQSGVTDVWAVDDGEKVEQTDLNHWASTDHGLNRVWDGTTIRVFG
ncbi:MAG: hypothetical protein WBH56_17040, partial [Bacteroidota bacterium]